MENLHRDWRYLGLSHIRQVRMMLRTGHPMYRDDCRRIIKRSQRDLARIRASLSAERGAS